MARLTKFNRQQGRAARQASLGDGPPVGLLGRGELLIANSSPHSYHARLSAAARTMIPLWHREATTWTTLTCHSNPPPH
jgi:hypothetical protein